jgi:flavin-dependent dehydrogenase
MSIPSSHCESDELWDVVVIGAGPAGAVVAYLLAQQGVRTLLVDAKPLGRSKVCGGCLNPRAVQLLRSIGLGDVLQNCPAVNRLAIHHAGRSAELSLPAGVSITRSKLDAALVDAATRAGAHFTPETSCRVLPDTESDHRLIRTTSSSGGNSVVRGRVVLACDGLGHPSLVGLPELASTVAPQARIGLGTTLENSQFDSLVPAETICMAVAEQGYVGLARAECGRVSIAAAVDPHTLAEMKSPACVVQHLLDRAGVGKVSFDGDVSFRGTPPITQSTSQVSAERLLLVGDAAGYVEPFTGEGMAAAIEGAIAVAPLARRAAHEWSSSISRQWQSEYTRQIRSRQLACRAIAWLVRHPRLLRLSLASVALQPQVGAAVARWIGSMRTSAGIRLS